MQSWPRKGDFQNLVEWGEVESVSALLKETIERLKLGPNEEWIQEVIL